MVDVPPLIVTPATTLVAAPNIVADESAVLMVVVQEVPAKLNELARQIQTNGVINNFQNDGSFILSSTIGNFKLSLPQLAGNQQPHLAQLMANLAQTQKPVEFLLQPGQPPTQGLITLPATSQAPPPQEQTASPSASAAGRRNDIQITSGVKISAVVLPNTHPSPSASPVNAALPIATEIQPSTANNEQILPLISQNKTSPIPSAHFETPPQNETDTANLNLSPPVKISVSQSTERPTLSPQPLPTTKPGNGALPPNVALNLRIDFVSIPNASREAPPIPTTQADQITATVIGSGPGGHLLLDTGENTLFVRQSANLPVGTRILLTLLPQCSEDTTVTPVKEGRETATLQQLMQLIVKTDPQAAQNILQNSLPQPNNMLSGTLLFLLSLFSQGDFKSWLSPSATEKKSSAEAKKLIESLASELSQSSGIVKDATVGEWKSLAIPFYDGDQYKLLYFHTRDNRRHRNDDASSNAAYKTRFLIDLKLSRLGDMQLDGLSQIKKLDLIVRSVNPLPHLLEKELTASYIKTMEAIGYTGGISFQNGSQGWIKMQKDYNTKELVT